MRTVLLGPVDSTNSFCEALDLNQVEDFTCYWTAEQRSGVGQRGNRWESEPGKNLTFSLVLHPCFLPADQQFRLTQLLSLAICDLLAALKPPVDALIKWPNDIYAEGGKLCGMLTSVRLQGNRMESAVCGIGLNVNQNSFPDWVPNPVSLQQLTARSFDLPCLLDTLLACIKRRYDALRGGAEMQQEYLDRLMNRGLSASYRHRGRVLDAVIEGVDACGRLVLTSADGERLCCGMKEIEYINQH